jgi:hypothetical protein
MLTYNFFDDYKKLLGALLRSGAYSDYSHSKNETDEIVVLLQDDPVLFGAIFHAVYSGIVGSRPHKTPDTKKLPYIKHMPELTSDPSKFLAGCITIAIVYTLKKNLNAPSSLNGDYLIPRYVIVNQLSRSINNLYLLISIAIKEDYKAFECTRTLAFGIITRLQYSGILTTETKRVKAKTEFFVKLNIKLPYVKINMLDIYESPGLVRILRGRPFYLDLHFTHVSSVIIDNSGNIYKASYNNVDVLQKLSNTKVWFDRSLAETNISSLKALYPELKAIQHSADAMAMLKTCILENMGVVQPDES